MLHAIEANKKNTTAFDRTAHLGDPAQAVELYVGAEYIQHNPLVGDGKQALVDFFRFDDNGKIVEHWDSIQQVPAENRNGNPMY